MAARGFLGAGDLYIARYNPLTAGFDDFRGPYEVSKFEIKPNVELKELTSRGLTTYGQVIESVPLPQPAEFSIAMPEVNKESMTIALFGTTSTINQGSGTVVDEDLVAKKGVWAPLANSNLASAGFTITDSTGATTYVMGTDYDVNYRLGWVRILESSAILNGADLLVSYTHNAITGTQIKGATNSQIRAKFLLQGKNFADDLPVIVKAHEAIIAADSAFDFLANDFASIELSGRLKTPIGMSEPFVVDLYDTAA
jgi:hypothetical protein